MRACRDLVGLAGGEVVALAFLVELSFLNGREGLGDAEVFSLIRY
jgi:adenine phosphoribosyltransferase